MNSKDAEVEVALLEIAKDLLQASDDLAATDPSSSAKLAHEAYEIGRDLGIVREHLDPSMRTAAAIEPLLNGSALNGSSHGHQAASDMPDVQAPSLRLNGSSSSSAGGFLPGTTNGARSMPRLGDPDDESDDELFRLLDRQRAVVPSHAELAPPRNGKQMTFEVNAPKRSGWFSWMRSRDLRHAG